MLKVTQLKTSRFSELASKEFSTRLTKYLLKKYPQLNGDEFVDNISAYIEQGYQLDIKVEDYLRAFVELLVLTGGNIKIHTQAVRINQLVVDDTLSVRMKINALNGIIEETV